MGMAVVRGFGFENGQTAEIIKPGIIEVPEVHPPCWQSKEGKAPAVENRKKVFQPPQFNAEKLLSSEKVPSHRRASRHDLA
jgi:hypothetical protein